jgi:hypothetical protein
LDQGQTSFLGIKSQEIKSGKKVTKLTVLIGIVLAEETNNLRDRELE